METLKQKNLMAGIDENGDPLPDEKLPPALLAKKLQAATATQLAESRIALNKANEDLKKAELAGNLPTIRLRQQALIIAQQNANTAESNYRMHALGTDIHGRELPGVQHDAGGTPVGTVISGQQNAAAKGDQATAQTRSAAEFARTLQPKFEKADALIAKLDKSGDLGKIAGRWNEFMAGKVGEGDPDYVRLRTMLGFMNTALVRAHFGARGAAQILDRFDNYAAAGKMDAATLRAALETEKDFVDTYANMDYAEKEKNKARRTGVSTTPVNDANYPAVNSLQEAMTSGKQGFTFQGKRYDIRNGAAFEVK
jgi:hypothetical protein